MESASQAPARQAMLAGDARVRRCIASVNGLGGALAMGSPLVVGIKKMAEFAVREGHVSSMAIRRSLAPASRPIALAASREVGLRSLKMSAECFLWLALLGQIASAEDVISQMQAQDGQIRTLEFTFHVEEFKGPGDFDVEEKELKQTTTRGRLRFRAPHEVKLERFSESGDVLEARAISVDGVQMKGFVLRPETGTVDGFIALASYEFYFPGVAGLFRHAQFEGLRMRLLTPEGMRESRVVTVGGLLRLSRSSLQWDVDPARGYWVVFSSGSLRDIHRKLSAEPFEASPGIWMAKRYECVQTRRGKVMLKETATVDLDSVRINQPIDANAFEIIFPIGTRVDDLVRNKSEFIGGQNSRDRKSVEELAVAASGFPAPVVSSNDKLTPGVSALRVPETSLWNRSDFITVVLSLLLLCGGWFGWQRWGR